MFFVDEEHKTAYNQKMREYGQDERSDGAVLLYLLTSMDSLRRHIGDLVEDDELSIKTDALNHYWQTHATERITRLAYNLFTWGKAPTTYDCITEESELLMYTPFEIFCGLDPSMLEVAIQAIRMAS